MFDWNVRQQMLFYVNFTSLHISAQNETGQLLS